MDKKQRHLINKYVELIIRRKVFIVSLLLLSLPIGLATYLLTPKVYQASSLLSYQQQKISPNKLSPDVATRIRDIVSTLTQIITSRTNLENEIKTFDLYQDLRSRLPMEDVVDYMRAKIEIKPSKRGDVFTIAFSGGNPQKVVQVTNALAAKFIEENLRYRQKRANETSAYTGEELQMAKRVMDKKEKAMMDYKLKYYNEMPDQRDTNMARLISLQEQYESKQDSIQELERTLVLIQDQIAARTKLIGVDEPDVNTTEDSSEDISDPNTKLKVLKAKLEALSLKYTDLHPEIRRLKKLIEKLKIELPQSGVAGASIATGDGVAPDRDDAGAYDPMLDQLEGQKKNAELSINSIKAEKELLKKKIEQYDTWVSAAPVREAEWSSLTREYGQLKSHYEYLVSQNLEAQSMLNLERMQKGSQFKIEDPARVPEKPTKPNFLIIMGMTVVIALGVGIGITLGIDFFDTSFRDPDMIETHLGVELLTTIPLIETGDEERRNKRKSIFIFLFFSLVTLGIGTIFVFIWLRGYIVI